VAATSARTASVIFRSTSIAMWRFIVTSRASDAAYYSHSAEGIRNSYASEPGSGDGSSYALTGIKKRSISRRGGASFADSMEGVLLHRRRGYDEALY
jgi:hypothetical protein